MDYNSEYDCPSELERGLDLLGIEADSAAVKKMLAYARLIHKWNRVYNLTAVRGFDGIINRHLLDSLTILNYIENDSRVVDIGSGAGLPGIPLSILRPDIVVALAECNGRKASFLRQVISDLGLSNVGVVNQRVEDFVPNKKFDVAVSRAFSSLETLTTLALPLLTDEGYVLAMKGMYPSAELDEIDYPYEVYNLHTLDDGVERHLVMIEANTVKVE